MAPPFMVELFAADGLPTGLRAVFARLVCLTAPKLPTLARVARTLFASRAPRMDLVECLWHPHARIALSNDG